MKNQEPSPSFIMLCCLIVVIFIIGVTEYYSYDLYGRKYLNDKENLSQIRCLLKTGELKKIILQSRQTIYWPQ